MPMDEDREDPWEIRRQAEALREAALADLDDIDQLLAERRAAGIGHRESVREPPQAPTPVPHAAEAPQRSFHRNWDAEQRWVEKIIDQRVVKGGYLEAIGIAIARLRKQLRDEMHEFAEGLGEDFAGLEKQLEARAIKSDTAVTELLMELERRLADLEQRAVTKPPPKPKLVDDNAA